jgi:hypothetical protein
MKAFRVLCVSLLAALSIVVVGAGPSWACSCVGGDAAEFVGRATVVVSGTVTDAVPPEGAMTSSLDPTTYAVDVDQVFKGEAGQTLQVLSPVSGASCGLEGIEPGRRYVVFASHQSMEGNDAEHLWANLCGGTAPATPSFVADVERVTGPGAAPATAEAAGTAYASALQLAADEDPDEPRLAGLAGPLGVVAGLSLVLLTVPLWVRLLRR